ncbi:heme-degrading domain-containing protein [Granulicella aggregans]|uniref:heme-degrading domain-containing protein n=1 Tax=Granulicella aggregans TaxID=474949 RepID=UPI0021E08CF9|nr:heme-degrading domain-containing protein [Granulicella aggregans]
MSIASDRAQIALQERELVFPSFNSEIAWFLGNTLRTLAETRKHPVVIDIRKFGDPDQQLFFTALPGTTPDNARWVLRKSRVVARFHRSSYAAGLYLEEQGTTFSAKYSLPDEDYATHGGAFPITVAETGVVGAVTVSGLPQRQDHELVIEALCNHLNLDHATYKLP